ncbi:MAG: hypothetical protein AAB687_01750 [Patescibacteria group bacterium]
MSRQGEVKKEFSNRIVFTLFALTLLGILILIGLEVIVAFRQGSNLLRSVVMWIGVAIWGAVTLMLWHEKLRRKLQISFRLLLPSTVITTVSVAGIFEHSLATFTAIAGASILILILFIVFVLFSLASMGDEEYRNSVGGNE